MKCFFHNGNPEDFDAHVDWVLSSGAISLGDAEAIRTFAEFLTAAGRVRPVPLQVLRDFQGFLGLSDAQLAELERQRADESG